jgi:hypothetical protein
MTTVPGRVMLVGEQPPRRWAEDERYRAKHSPMFPYPKGSAGHRLWEMSGLSRADYVYGLERVNLIPEWTVRWDSHRAIERARTLVFACKPSVAFLCGRRVATAFGLPEVDLPHKTTSGVLECELVAIPHPSGRCREYNDPRVGEWVRAEFERLEQVIAEWKERRMPMLWRE